MLLSVLSFFLGVFLVQQMTVLVAPLVLLSLFILGCFLGVKKYWVAALFLFGFIWASGFAYDYFNQVLPPDLQGQDLLIEGEVIGLPNINARRVRFDFKVKQAADLPSKLRLSWYYPEYKISAGQQWRFYVKLKRPHGMLNPGGFDYEKWLYAQGVGATGYIRQTHKAKLLATSSDWFTVSLWRQSYLTLLSKQAISREGMALIKALTLGDKSAISSQQWSVLSKTGTNHLMAISGLHIGLLAGMVYWLVFKSWLRFPSMRYSAPQIAAIISLMAAFFYAAMAGFAIPTQRALIMLAVLSVTILLRRNVRVLNVLASAFLLVILLNPLAVLSVGFYLSFLAVFYIIYAFSSRLGRETRYITSLKIHWVVALGLLPSLLLFFQQVSIISPIANMLAVPIVSFIVVPVSLLAVFLLPFLPDVSGLLLAGVDTVLHYLWQFLIQLVALPDSSLILPQPKLWCLLLAFFGVLLLLAPRGIPARYLGLFLLLPLFFPKIEKPKQGEVYFTLLDVGQGLSVVVETARHYLVFDTGARFSDKFDMGKNVVLPFLYYRQVSALDKLIVSHADNDHIGGARAILSKLPTNQVLSSVPNKLSDFSAIACQEGQNWQWDSVNFQLLSPTKNEFNNENDNSCVLKVDSPYGSFLLTGDIEWAAEQALVKKYRLELKSDILVAAHHGSKTSSSLSFLKAVSPRVILIPAGAPNRFGFPHMQVLKRYQTIQADYFISGEQGALFAEFRKDNLTVQGYRKLVGHYWNE